MRLWREHDVAALEARRDAKGLVRLLRHDRSLPENEAAAAALTRVADAASLPVLVKASASRHWGERQAAVAAIAAIRDLRAAYPLAKLAMTDHAEVSCAACQSLSAMGRDSLAGFLAGLAVCDAQERERFASELGHLDDHASPHRALRAIATSTRPFGHLLSETSCVHRGILSLAFVSQLCGP